MIDTRKEAPASTASMGGILAVFTRRL
jgi:hypothetical protein